MERSLVGRVCIVTGANAGLGFTCSQVRAWWQHTCVLMTVLHVQVLSMDPAQFSCSIVALSLYGSVLCRCQGQHITNKLIAVLSWLAAGVGAQGSHTVHAVPQRGAWQAGTREGQGRQRQQQRALGGEYIIGQLQASGESLTEGPAMSSAKRLMVTQHCHFIPSIKHYCVDLVSLQLATTHMYYDSCCAGCRCVM
jgi:hypothetical protein